MDAIGAFTFVKLSGPPERVQQEWDLQMRPGVPGVSMWATGIRGEPFTRVSEAWVLNIGQGRELLAAYKGLTVADPVPYYFGNAFPESNHLYKVLKVRSLEGGLKPMVAGYIPGDANVYQCMVFAEWTLVPIFYIPPEEP